jgi:hypothetical protein
MPINNILPKKNNCKTAPKAQQKAKKRPAQERIAPEGRR